MSVVIEMSMSIDGYIAGPNDGPSNGLGDHGAFLHHWMFGEGASAPGEGITGPDKQALDELRDGAGAMISGRRLYEITSGWRGSHPFGGIPVFVISHDVPRDVPKGRTPFTFVTDGVVSAVAQARAAAGDKDVYVIGGASVDQQLLDAGLVDELRIDVVPIVLGGGIRLFEKVSAAPIELEQLYVSSSAAVAHIRYKVLR
jgi:dihydrofolate reductase